MPKYSIYLPQPHPKQADFINCETKRVVIRAGRRSGKTVGVSIYAVQQFLSGRRVLYATPTQEQVGRFWTEISRALQEPIDAKIFKKNETDHTIELPGTEQRIRAKTAWNSDTLRGDYADVLILDEWQLMDEDAWGVVGAPMLLDNDGDARFIYTPPSLHSRSTSKARDPRHAAKLYAKAQADTSGRWKTFTFTSHDNPHISTDALTDITGDMTSLAYRQEILAEDIDEAPGALWTRVNIDANRVNNVPNLTKIVVAVDPSATSGGDEAGIMVAGIDASGHTYILEDASIQGSPLQWATAAVTCYNKYKANTLVAESNQGGEMVSQVIHQVDPAIPVKLVHASRGKATRAEPVAALYEKNSGHHVGNFPLLEDELCQWVPGDASPNRLDALVWAITELIGNTVSVGIIDDPFDGW